MCSPQMKWLIAWVNKFRTGAVATWYDVTRRGDVAVEFVLCGSCEVPGPFDSSTISPRSEFVDPHGDFAGRINTYYAPTYLKLGVFMDDKLAADEARRSVQHESVKANVEGEVQSEIADQAQAPVAGESQKIREVAGEDKA